MSDDATLENEIAELRGQMSFLEAAKAEADHAVRKADQRLVILLLRLANERGIFAVMHEGGRAWEFLSKEEFLRQHSGLATVSFPGVVKPLKKKAA